MSMSYLALGSNLGDRWGHLRDALQMLANTTGCKVIGVGPMIETAAVDAPAGSPPFLNSAVGVETSLSPEALLVALLGIERSLGRTRNAGDIRNGPRVIDLDLLLYDDQVKKTLGLTLPHPRMHERRFVLEPLAAIAADVVHPTLHKTIKQLLAELPAMKESA